MTKAGFYTGQARPKCIVAVSSFFQKNEKARIWAVLSFCWTLDRNLVLEFIRLDDAAGKDFISRNTRYHS